MLEKTATSNAQYLRRQQLEVSDVPESLGNENLSKLMATFLSITGVAVDAGDIEVYHRLKNKKL